MNWFLNLKTAVKLTLAFAVVCVLTGAVGYVGVTRLSTVNGLLGDLYSHDMRGLVAMKDANIALVAVGRETRRATSMPDPADIRKSAQEVERYASEFDASLSVAEKTQETATDRAMLEEVRRAFGQYVAGCRECIEGALQKKPEVVTAALKSAKAHADVVDATLKKLCQAKEQAAERAHDQGQATSDSARATMWGTVVAAVVMAMVLGFGISRVIVRPMARAVAVLDAVAAGDFTVRLDVDTKDEIGKMGRALNSAVKSMQETLSEVQAVAFSVAAASQQLSSSSQQLASGAQEQASSLEETAASLEEITSTIKHNADNAQQASQLATGSRDVAERGGQVVARAVDAMREINESSKKINDIITTIDELAFQTNLLALNAAVEAARAGEQGRGFAVVAAEVRNLARRSATAAKEIKGMIHDSVRNVESGASLVAQSGQALGEIVTSVKRVTDIVAEIASASREQAAGIDQVSLAVAQMDQVTQSNAAQTEELSSTAEALAGQGTQLQAQVARFKLGDAHTAPVRTMSAAARPPRAVVSRPARRKAVPVTSQRLAPMPPPPAAQETGSPADAEGFEDF